MLYFRSQIVRALVFGSSSPPSYGKFAILDAILDFLGLFDSVNDSISLDLFRVITGLDVGVVLFERVPLAGVVDLKVPSGFRILLAPRVSLMLFLRTPCKVWWEFGGRALGREASTTSSMSVGGSEREVEGERDFRDRD